jgi:hypothetical protein
MYSVNASSQSCGLLTQKALRDVNFLLNAADRLARSSLSELRTSSIY